MLLLKRWLAPPVFKDEEKTHQAYLLHIILLAVIAIPIPFIIYLIIQKPEEASRALRMVSLAEGINVILFLMLRQGYVHQASIAHIITLWLILAVSSATSSSVYGVAYMLGNGLVITIAGILLGGRGALIMTLTAAAQGGAMVYAEMHGWAPPDILDDPLSTWIVVSVIFTVVMTLQTLSTNDVHAALKRAQASEERYRLISEVSSDYTFSIEVASDGAIHLKWVAGAFETITGYIFEEYVASGGWLAHLHPDDVEQDAQNTATLKTNKPVVTEIRTFKKNGDLSWVRVYAHPIWDEKQNRLAGIVGGVKDITVRKRAEEALTRERDLLQIIMDNIPDFVYLKDSSSRFIRINKAHAKFLKVDSPEDAIGKTDLDFQPIDLARQFIEEEQRLLESGQPIVDRVEFNPFEDGTPRWFAATKVPIKDSSGRLTGIIGVSRDITRQKLTEAMLAYERDILQIFMDNIPDQVYFKDTESRFVRINQGQARFLGVNDPQEAVGKTDLDFQNPELAREFLAEEKRIIETGEPVLSRIEFNPTRDGTPRWLLTNKVPAKNELGQIIGTIGISFDITEQKLAEEQGANRRNMLEKVVRFGQYVTEVNDVRTTLQRIWHTVRTELGFDRLGIYLYDSETNTMNGTYGTNNRGEMVEEWDARILLVNETIETNSFLKALQEPNGIYFTHNYDAEHDIPDGGIMQGVGDFAAVAAWAGNKPVAVLCVDQLLTRRPITEYQLEMLRLFAGYAGLGIENSRLQDAIQNELSEQKKAEEAEQQRRVMMEKVIQLGKQVTEVHDIRTTLKRIWHNIHHDLNFDRLGIFLHNPATNAMDGTFGTNHKGEMVEEWDMHIPLDKSVFESFDFIYVLQEPEGLYSTHNYDIERNVPKSHPMYGVKHYAAVAARAGDKPVAVICVDHLISGRPISSEQLEALRLFAGYAGLAIENSRLHESLQNELLQQIKSEEAEQRRRLMMEKVFQLGKQVTEVSDFPTTLRKIWHGVRYDLDFDRVGIFLYNPKENIMEGTYGTDREGKIWEAWHVRFELDKNALFYKVLSRPDGLFFTKDYEKELNIPPGDEMAGVKYCAMVAVWTGNKPVAIISVDQFITNRPILEEQLEALRLFAGYAGLAISNAHLNDALEDELAQRQTFIDELETKNAELERFTYTVSHDLKSPLVTITGFLGYLEKDALTGDREKIRNNINRISNAAEKMQALLNDLLELSRIGRLMNPPENLPFEEIVNEAIGHVQGQLDEKNVLLKIQKDLPIIRCDRARLVEVMQNLIDNAAKYSNPNIQPVIEIGTVNDQKNNTVYFVRDNGIGIEPQFHERVFGLFNKLNPHSEGTGIGLSLVKRIIEVHNGQIWVESEAGKGATFYFTLPKA